MQKRIAGSTLLTLTVIMALMPLAKATTIHYWWDNVYFFDDDTPYPHPDTDYYDVSRYDDWSIAGAFLHHCQINTIVSGTLVDGTIGFFTVLGAVLGAKIGGVKGALNHEMSL